MELLFRGIDEEEKECIPILPSWAYSEEEIKDMIEDCIKDKKKFILTHKKEETI